MRTKESRVKASWDTKGRKAKLDYCCAMVAAGILSFDEDMKLHRNVLFQNNRLTLTDRIIGKLNQPGYNITSIYNREKNLSVKVHQLIWVYFNGEIPEGLEINHIDGDPSNNHLENLELVTHRRNIQLAIETGSMNIKGWNNYLSSLTKEDYMTIKRYLDLKLYRYTSQLHREKYPHITARTFRRVVQKIKEGVYNL